MPRSEAELAIRSRVQTVYLGRNSVLTRVLGRPKLFLSTEDIGFAGHVMMDGYWEIWLTQYFARIVRPGMTVVDVGANFGYYSVLFGDAVGPTGHVIAVEPVPATAEFLTRSINLNGHAERTRIERLALGRNPDGAAHLYVPVGEPKNATVVAAAAAGTISVPTTTLDLLARDVERIDLVKIDAEGAEIDIIAGMSGIIERHAPQIVLEFNAARYADAPGFLTELRRQLGAIQWLGFDGKLRPVTDADLLGKNVGEDWLLVLGGHR